MVKTNLRMTKRLIERLNWTNGDDYPAFVGKIVKENAEYFDILRPDYKTIKTIVKACVKQAYVWYPSIDKVENEMLAHMWKKDLDELKRYLGEDYDKFIHLTHAIVYKTWPHAQHC